MRDALEALEGQLNRRIQLEVKDPIYSAIDDLKSEIKVASDDAEDNENKLSSIVQKVAGIEAQVELINRCGGSCGKQ